MEDITKNVLSYVLCSSEGGREPPGKQRIMQMPNICKPQLKWFTTTGHTGSHIIYYV